MFNTFLKQWSLVYICYQFYLSAAVTSTTSQNFDNPSNTKVTKNKPMDKLIVSSIISAGIMCLMQTLLGLGTAEAEDARDGPPDADDPEYDVEDVDGEAPPIYGECGKPGRICG